MRAATLVAARRHHGPAPLGALQRWPRGPPALPTPSRRPMHAPPPHRPTLPLHRPRPTALARALHSRAATGQPQPTRGGGQPHRRHPRHYHPPPPPPPPPPA